MAKYKLEFTLTETFIVEVEAEDNDEAREIAHGMSRYDVWEDGYSDGDYELEFVDFEKIGE